mgnify:CR=1 FL=1|jgi:hypothetical protein
MTRRVTISAPDDVDQLAAMPACQSADATEALRRRAADEMRALLTAAGHRDYPYDPAGARRRLGGQRVRPDVRDAVIARLAEATGRSADDVRAELDRRAA